MDFKKVELKWQKYWAEHPEIYYAQDSITNNQETNKEKPKKYVLAEFPYPSGSGLHIGHTFMYVGSDVQARFWRMKGFEVLFPMGWDAFGLPTENYAIKMKRKPQEITKENTEMFKSQMKKLAFSFDWSREINTTDPDYYKWTQWIFIKLFEKGLAYKKEMPINWCPSCKIGLANEEVVDGNCERCGATVSRRSISQWVLKITEYADKLIEGLNETDYAEKVKTSQINWIGKSEGAKVKFRIKDGNEFLEVFTTRPDTLYGATFMVISPEHKLVSEILNQGVGARFPRPIVGGETPPLQAIEDYVKKSRGKSELERTEINKEKTGVFSGLYAINPVNNKEIPIWISDFVLASYGTGAIMSVPAHDERDNAFAKKFGLPIIQVIENEGHGKLINSGEWNGIMVPEEKEKIFDWIEKNGIGEKTASYHLRDWIFSRQHYWGEPIPMISCPEHGWVPEKLENLPIKLPEVEHYEPTDDGQSPLANMKEWVKTVCPVCGKEATRETDTMPNWAGSDWYYLAYCFANKLKGKIATSPEAPRNDVGLNDTFVDIFSDSRELLKTWMPVDIYIGGDEHTTLHLLYSRFIYRFLYDIGMVPTKEPYFKRVPHGVILGTDNQRMSKSKGNVIVPEVVADKYGVDVVRMYLMFMGPFDGTMVWNENTLMGVKRFLDRFEKAVVSYQLLVTSDSNKEVKVIINKLIKGVGEDIEGFKYNTAIAKMMETLNKIQNDKFLMSNEELKVLVKLVAPFAPYLAEELWSRLGETSSVHISPWPEYDKKYIVDEVVTVVVAINGKMRDQLKISNDKLQMTNEIIKEAKKLPKIKVWIGDKEIIREIYVPGRMVNLVVK